ncbi:hypothetical protein OSB04_un001656 [Centaurea solstitialis]|uniref:Uncharacterized protein n=1 Tax=Centaurea solstitialis TaxID=347529 RepID=A0AA38W4U7_9ASTR|nr:hypothetical protein OSB04_un001656 [Centaurea solstitialis]
MDDFTASMCDNAWGRPGFAKVLVDVWAVGDLKRELQVVIPNLYGGKGTEVRFELNIFGNHHNVRIVWFLATNPLLVLKQRWLPLMSKVKLLSQWMMMVLLELVNRKQKGVVFNEPNTQQKKVKQVYVPVKTTTGGSTGASSSGVKGMLWYLRPRLRFLPLLLSSLCQLKSSYEMVAGPLDSKSTKPSSLDSSDSFAHLKEFMARRGHVFSTSNTFSALANLQGRIML